MLRVLNEKSPKMNSHFQVNPLNGFYICPNGCGREYKHTATLYQHLKYDCGKEKQFRCFECRPNRWFSRKTQLKTHVVNIHRKIVN